MDALRSNRLQLGEKASSSVPHRAFSSLGQTRAHEVSAPKRIPRFAISAAVAGGIVAACASVPHVHLASLVLFLLLAIVLLATLWDFSEAAFATFLGDLLVGYLSLPDQRWTVATAERWVLLITFPTVALLASYLAVRTKHQRNEAVSRRREMEQLYAFGKDFPIGGNQGSVLDLALNSLVRSFQLDAVAYYDHNTGGVARAGENGEALTEDLLCEAVRKPQLIVERTGGFYCVQIRSAGQVIGSLGLHGRSITEPTVRAIAERIEVGLEKICAFEAQRLAEEEKKSEALKAAVLDSLVHEIKTPVSVIKTAASSLLSRDSDAGIRRELVTIINEETDHLDDSISQAFWTARVEAGILREGKSSHQVRPLINEVISDFGALLKGRSVTIDVPDFLPPANFDTRMIKGVLKELLRNAVKYSPSESPLTISVQQAGDEIITSVGDSGPGVRPEERGRIFEKHYRGGGVKAPGTGLGLAFAKTIVEAHGGQIGVRNGVGSGSVFYFSLPVFHEEVA
jgi:two-component system, OmpR family, sensor histidine kinase KdpD